MLNYEEFKKAVTDCFMTAMGEEYADYELQTIPVRKKGRDLDGLTVARASDSDTKTQVMPTVYLNDLYREYIKNEDFYGIVKKACEAVKEGLIHGPELLPYLSPENSGSNIVFQLINRRDNETFLEEVPHRDILDLSVIYRWVIRIEDHGISSTVIDYKMAEYLDMDEEELYSKAFENTRRIFPAHIIDMKEVLYQIFSSRGLTKQETDIIAEQIPEDSRLYVLTNSVRCIGSSVILYEEVLSEMAERTGGDIFVIPISVDEVLVTPVNSAKDPRVLAQMLGRANNEFESVEDRLSENIYIFSSEKGKLSIAAESSVSVGGECV